MVTNQLCRIDGDWRLESRPLNAPCKLQATLLVKHVEQSMERLKSLCANLQGDIHLSWFPSRAFDVVTLSQYTKHAKVSHLKQVLQKSSFDYLIWPEQGLAPKLMVFDMDSTFIEIEVIDELARYAGVADKVSKVTERAMQGELDFAESLRHRVACLRDLDATVIEQIASQLPLSPGVEDLVRQAKLNGVASAIVSGGFEPFVQKLAEQLPLYAVKANQLEIIDQKLSGAVLGPIVDASAKADFVVSLAEQLDLPLAQVLCIGDGANDLQMMGVAGFSLAYRAKPMVQAQALGRFNEATLDCLADIFAWR